MEYAERNTTPKGTSIRFRRPTCALRLHRFAGNVGDLDGFDVSARYPEMPARAELADYAEAGATWTVFTGWVDQLRDVIAQGPPG